MQGDEREYWNEFYAGARLKAVPAEPSAFAGWAERFIHDGAYIWEFGFGNARDSLYFAEQGYSVHGFDFAVSAVEGAAQEARRRELKAEFETLDLTDEVEVDALVKRCSTLGTDVNVYGRFLIHSLTDRGRQNLLRISATALARGGMLLLEFRTDKDEGAKHLFGDDHFRKYLDPGVVCQEIREVGGTIVDEIEGYGLAIYKSEDPHVSRIAAQWVRS